MKLIFIFALTLLVITQQTPITDESIPTSLTMLDSSLLDVIWCGNNQQDDTNVLILTGQGTVYKSTDRGVQWEKLSDIFLNSAVKEVGDLQTKVGFINRIVKSPVDNNVVTFLGSEGINFITEDCGNTIKSYGKGRHFKEFQYHPTERNWVLGTSWNSCNDKKSKLNCKVTKDLYLSVDLGKSWDKLATYVVQYGWAKKSSEEKNIPNERILWSQENGATGNQRIGGWSMRTHLYYSDDFLKTKNIIVNQGNKFLITDRHIYVAQVKDAQSQHVNLVVSDSNLLDYDFKFAQLPEELKQHSFTILDSSDNTVYLNINHYQPNSPMGAIYKSDQSGTYFVKTLSNNIRDPTDGQCDFEKVQGITGIFIANTYTDRASSDFQYALNSDDANDIQVETSNRGKTKLVSNVKTASQKLQQNKQTKITFDQGSIWQLINAPLKDSKGSKIQCDTTKNCGLHLHSISSKMQYGPFYSSDNSLGLIMGTGNIGKSLKYRKDEINTYLSRDGGLTWAEVKKGSHIYEFADHGGLILMADDQQGTQYIHYSWDEGTTWKKIQFWDKLVEITNIVTEPSNVGSRFLVYGTTNYENGGQIKTIGVVISVDFSDLHMQQCVGAEQPNSDDSDYESWSPNGKLSPDCLLGKKVTYVRRKRTARCFNGQDFERAVSVEQCTCSEEDWECDFQYERDSKSGQCIYKGDNQTISTEPPLICKDYYEVTKGYRKVAGDICVNGIDHSPDVYRCNGGFLNMSWTNLLVIGGILLACYYGYSNQELVKNILDQNIEKLMGLIKKKDEGYIDFSKKDFGGKMDQFDDTLIENAHDEEKLEKPDLESNPSSSIQADNQQQPKQNHEESNLLGDDDDDVDLDSGFNPNQQ